jgi:hypothetical protein
MNIAIIHIAGPKPTMTTRQQCTRCHALLAKAGETGWGEGCHPASYGSGSWSAVLPDVALATGRYRNCGRQASK